MPVSGSDSNNDDDFFLDDDNDTELMRDLAHQRLAKMKESQRVSYGSLQFCQNEREILSQDIFNSNNLSVVILHFTNPAFETCAKMTELLQSTARTNVYWRCMEVRAQEAPFLVTKLNIRILPCVIVVKDGLVVDRIVGFEGVEQGNKTPAALFQRLSASLNQEK